MPSESSDPAGSLDHHVGPVSGVVCGIALACAVLVAWRYPSLPETLPATRWSSTDKSVVSALRVPTINLASVVAIAAVWRAFSRAGLPTSAGVALMTAAAVKAVAESIELLVLPESIPLLAPLVVASVLGALAVAGLCARGWIGERRWRMTRWTGPERVVAIGATIVIAAASLLAAR